MTRRGLGSVWSAIGVAACVVATACTTTVTGVAVPGEPAGPAVIPAPTGGNGPILESHRLAAATPLVQQHFPDRTGYCSPQDGFTTASGIEALYFTPGTVAHVLEYYGLVAAWGECGTDGAGLGTLTLTMELSDPASAMAAAREMAAAFRTAELRSSTVLDGGQLLLASAGGRDIVQAWVPVGRLVGYVYHSTPAGQGVESVEPVIDDHAALMAAFTATPQADLSDLPLDPHGLAGRTVRPRGTPESLTGPYDLDSYLRLALDPVRERELLEGNGFVGMFVNSAIDDPLSYVAAVYAFPGSAQTNAVFNGFAELERTRLGSTVPFVLPAIPDAPCFVLADDSLVGAGAPTSYTQRCYVGFGSYLAGIDVIGLTDPGDVGRMTALLTAQRDLIRG